MGNIFANSCIDCSRRNQIKEKQNQIFEGILEQECLLWDTIQNRFLRTKFFVTQPKNNKISYISDSGSIMRIEQIGHQQFQQNEILTNIEHIKYLNWIGQYGNNYQKIGKWKAFWQGEALIGIGGIYSEDGKKQGQWNQLFQNYSKQFQVCESGEYLNDQRIKQWKYTLENEEIGGGLYDNQVKQGQWIELSNNFQVSSQITLNGQYKNGNKVGRWDIYHRMSNHQQLIGGGTYDNQEGRDSFKIGKWQEPSDGFHNDNQVMYTGEYKNGIKVGKWEIQMVQDNTGQIMKIGGGEYDDKQEALNHLGIKQGKWFELIDLLQNPSQILYYGEYKNGNKVGRWEIYLKGNKDKSIKLIGGGLYQEKLDDQFHGDIKQGRWVELSEGFMCDSQVTWKGDYKNNNKVGRWNLSYQWDNIGGGSYDEVDGGSIVKVGKWIEFSDQFHRRHKVIHQGEYKNGKKVGRWHTCWLSGIEIGGGYYDEQGNGIKIGKWIDLYDGFNCQKQVTYQGEYNNGNKVGRWNTYWISGFYIGGGYYDEKCNGNKIGKWIDLDEEFYSQKQVTYHGEYKNGNKVGRWNTYWISGAQLNEECCYDGRWNNHETFEEQIGGGCYDQQGDGIKIGKWIELDDGFYQQKQVTYHGEYENGKKIRRWNICLISGEQIGGGYYDEQGDGIKIGKWIDLNNRFNMISQVIYAGEYKNGKKVGMWTILHRNNRAKSYQQFGGGFYDDKGNGIRIGKWIQFYKFAKEYGYLTCHGNYQNGKKVGKWNLFYESEEITSIQYQN